MNKHISIKSIILHFQTQFHYQVEHDIDILFTINMQYYNIDSIDLNQNNMSSSHLLFLPATATYEGSFADMSIAVMGSVTKTLQPLDLKFP